MGERWGEVGNGIWPILPCCLQRLPLKESFGFGTGRQLERHGCMVALGTRHHFACSETWAFILMNQSINQPINQSTASREASFLLPPFSTTSLTESHRCWLLAEIPNIAMPSLPEASIPPHNPLSKTSFPKRFPHRPATDTVHSLILVHPHPRTPQTAPLTLSNSPGSYKTDPSVASSPQSAQG